jgi:perosamine synthetase
MIYQYKPVILPEYAEAVKQQVLTGWVGCGTKVLEFENRIKLLSGAKYALATTSGTAALMMAIYALRLPPHSIIAFPAYTFLAGANAIRALGHEVLLVDVDATTMCMSTIDLKDKLRSYIVDAVMFVNHNGYVGDAVKEISNICNEYHIPMLEDSSQGFTIPGAGRTGICGVFSFSVPKIVTTGQGGVLITDDEHFAARAAEYRDHGENWRKTRIHNKFGINLKFNDVSASLGIAQFDRIESIIQKKSNIMQWYKEFMGDTFYEFGYDYTWMVIHRCVKDIELVIDVLNKNDIQSVQYYKPINHNPIYAHSTFSGAEMVYNSALYLPSSLNLTKNDIQTIASIIQSI